MTKFYFQECFINSFLLVFFLHYNSIRKILFIPLPSHTHTDTYFIYKKFYTILCDSQKPLIHSNGTMVKKEGERYLIDQPNDRTYAEMMFEQIVACKRFLMISLSKNLKTAPLNSFDFFFIYKTTCSLFCILFP